MKRTIFLLMISLAGMFCTTLKAQNVGIKTNLLSDALLNANLGVEVGLAPRWTLDLSGYYNAWALSDDRKWKHWLAQPEARYWFCEKFNGHFLGLHAFGGQYNVGNVKFPLNIFPDTKGYRHEGYYYGAGIAYGYQWILGNHWNLEASLGVGYARAHYDKYDCPKCGEWRGKGDKNYWGVTKAAVSLIYIIK